MRNGSNTRDTRTMTDLPSGTAALADITMTAWQRLYAINAETFGLLLAQSSKAALHSLRAPGEPSPLARPDGDPMQAWRAFAPPTMQALPPETLAELYRYGASVMQVWQTAGIATANLMAARLQGQHRDVDNLTRDAREEAIDATESAMAAAGTAFTRGLTAMTRVGEMAAQAATRSAALAETARQDEDEEDDDTPRRRRARSGTNGSARTRHH